MELQKLEKPVVFKIGETSHKFTREVPRFKDLDEAAEKAGGANRILDILTEYQTSKADAKFNNWKTKLNKEGKTPSQDEVAAKVRDIYTAINLAPAQRGPTGMAGKQKAEAYDEVANLVAGFKAEGKSMEELLEEIQALRAKNS